MKFSSCDYVDSTTPTKALLRIIRFLRGSNPDRTTYHYPLASLDQPRFISPRTGHTHLNFTILADPQFDSPLCRLLGQLEDDGHNIDGPITELKTMRDTVRKIDKTLAEIDSSMIRFRNS